MCLFSRGFIFAVYADWKPYVKVYTHKNNLDRALVQWQNMAIHKFKNVKIAKIQALQKCHP